MKNIISNRIFIIFLLMTFSGLAQDVVEPVPHDKSYAVKWIGSFSTREDLNISTGFFREVKNFLFGSDEFALSKPVNLIAKDTNQYFIIDQGLQSLILIDKNNNQFEMYNQEDILLPSLVGMDQFDEDNYLVTDSKNCQIYNLNISDLSLSIFEVSDSLSQPTGIAVNQKKGEIVIAETNLHRLRVLNYEGEILDTIGKRGGDSVQFNFPTYLTFDRNNNLYVVDALNYRVQIFDENYNLKYIFGEQGDSPGYIASAKGIAVDGYGHIYLVDARLHTVQVFDHFGNFLYIFGYQGKNNGEFWMPSGISIDENNFIYVADSYNSRIQIFHLVESENK